MINSHNWNYTFFSVPNKKAFISLGADPALTKEDIKISYLVTVTDLDGKDIFQRSLPSLDQAIADINQRYSHWEVVDARLAAQSSGGCGSCDAH